MAVSADGLTVMETGRLLLPPTDLRIAADTAAVLAGGTSISRLILAHALTGRLPTDRVRRRGALDVFGATSPADIRGRSLLALPWRARSRPTAVGRRLAALDWAAERAVSVRNPSRLLIVLSPGLEGLQPDEVAQVAAAATNVHALGPTVLVTGTDQLLTAHNPTPSMTSQHEHEANPRTISATITVTALPS